MSRRKPKTNEKSQVSLKILFADDEQSLQELMRLELDRMGHEVTVCPDGTTAMAALERNAYDCLLVDLHMPGSDGIEVIARAKLLSPDIEAIVLTGKSSTETAIAALREGAFDYLTKPCSWVDLKALLVRVASKREMNRKYRALQQRLARIEGKSDLIGDSDSMRAVRELIGKVAPTNSTVLILGETGTGKELVARALHRRSTRTEMPFVPINCGALPEHLIESELFGHCKGAFTGADGHRTGLAEMANGGTLFLDEIGELPKSMQAKLLRFLESGEIRRVGENEAVTCDVRVVCATHRNLNQMVANETFREDLFFRINTFEIRLPPLRERPEDIATLARLLAARHRANLPENVPIFTQAVQAELATYPWPGNVRELANVLEHAMILGGHIPIDRDDLPRRFTQRATPPFTPKSTIGPTTAGLNLREIEMRAVHKALERHDGNKSKAAEELGISLKTLYNKLNQDTAQAKTA